MAFDGNWYVQDSLNEVGKGVIKTYLRGITGHIAEFGTMTGRSASTMAAAITQSEAVYANKISSLGAHARDLYLFDSFEGLPEVTEKPDLDSTLVANGVWGPGTCFGLSAEQLRDQCAQNLSTDRIHIFEGWFKDTIPTLKPDLEFALVHIDCDLYSSARDVLNGLFERSQVAKGALLYFDDWDCNASRQDLGERKAWLEAVEKYKIKYSATHSYGAFGHAVIVHEYEGA